MQIKIKKLHPDAKIPSYAHSGDAGFDLFAAEEHTINPGERVWIKTGLALEIPDGYVGLTWDKSSMAFKYGLKSMGGVIDSGYRGEIQVCLYNVSKESYTISQGDKVAQMLIQKVEQAQFIEVDQLSDSSRGEGAFGSTGKK